MSDQQVTVTFLPSGRRVSVLPGTMLLEAAGRAGLTIQTPCGGAGSCGRCRVQIAGDSIAPASADRDVFNQQELAAGWRLACQSRISQDTSVTIPGSSLFAGRMQIITSASDAAGNHAPDPQPSVRKVYVQMAPPTLGDCDSDMMRLERCVGAFKTDLAVARRLPQTLRAGGYSGTAVLADGRLIDFELGDTTGRCYGVAVDVGTTTLAASLLDLCSGEELAVTARTNPQARFGDDVLTRVLHASGGEENLAELRELILEAADEMVGELCQGSSVSRSDIYEIAFSGNTTMEHLLCGIDVSPLATVPFTPAHQRGLMLSATELGVTIHPGGQAYVFPVVGGFVGGDAVAGMLATGLGRGDDATLMIDIGTNGEIALSAGGEIWAASTAAGPAFEGARISCGMRACPGAIEKVVFNNDVELSVIGNVAAKGICGSGLVDMAAGLLEAGIVTPEGRLLTGEQLPAGLAEPLRKRVRTRPDGQGQFVLADGDTPVAVTQQDMRELQLAVGAIRAGVSILLHQASLTAVDLKRVLIAGGFGSFIRRSHAQRIGLLPGQVDHSRIRYVGNTSLTGAKWVLLSSQAHLLAEELASRTVHVQLSEDPDFQTEFVEAMIFPAE